MSFNFAQIFKEKYQMEEIEREREKKVAFYHVEVHNCIVIVVSGVKVFKYIAMVLSAL